VLAFEMWRYSKPSFRAVFAAEVIAHADLRAEIERKVRTDVALNRSSLAASLYTPPPPIWM